MRAHTNITAPEPEGRGLKPTRYGVPSPALLARAERGFARFLAQRGEDQDDGADGGEHAHGPVRPEGRIEAELPLDRAPYECLVKAVLAWTGPDTLTERDYKQIGLQLTGHARAVASDVPSRRSSADGQRPRALAEVVLGEAEGWLSTTLEGTVRCVQNRARLVRALYERLDRLEAVPASERVAPTGG